MAMSRIRQWFGRRNRTRGILAPMRTHERRRRTPYLSPVIARSGRHAVSLRYLRTQDFLRRFRLPGLREVIGLTKPASEFVHVFGLPRRLDAFGNHFQIHLAGEGDDQ